MSSVKWKTETLGPFCVKVGSGFTPLGGEQVYQSEGTSFIRSQNIYNGHFEEGGIARLREADADQLKGVELCAGDVLLNITGDSVARCCQVPPHILPARVNQHVSIIRPNPDEFDPRFLMYFLISPHMQSTMLSLAGSGGTRKALTKQMIQTFRVPKPEVSVQRRISDVLSSYDDLIESNRRRMKLLEEAARLLYQEWFVRFKFPGYEHNPIVNGLPPKWEFQSLDHLCQIGRGASPRPIMAFMGGEVPWFKIGDATSSGSMYIFETEEHVTEDGAKKSVSVGPGSLILSNSATCGIPYFTAVQGCIHDGWLYFSNFKQITPAFLYLHLDFKRTELVSSVGDGSTQKNLNTSAVGRLKACLPSEGTLLGQFEALVNPMFGMILNLARQNLSLKKARDLLLPRLMTGELAV